MKNSKSFLKCISMVLAVMFLTLLPGNALLSIGNHNSVWGSEKINQLIQDDLTDMISSLRGEAYTIDLEEEDLTDFSILDPVSFVDLDFISNDAPEVIHFPLADKNGKIFAVFSVGRSETGYGRNFGQSFSRVLESARMAGADEVFLYQKGWDLYALDPVTEQVYRLNDSPQARASDNDLVIKMHSAQHEYNQLYSTISPLEKEDYIDNSVRLNEYNAEHTAKYTQSVRGADSAPTVTYPESKILTGVPHA